MKQIIDLVRKNQSYKDKLSSHEEFAILDELLYRALSPLETETEAYKEWLGEVIAFYASSRRRFNDEVLNVAILGLAGNFVAKNILSAGIDRELVFAFLSRVSTLGTELEDAQVYYACKRTDRTEIKTLQRIAELKALLGSGSLVVPAIRTAKYWYGLALDHKKSIIDHYLKLLLKTSSRICHASGGRVEVEPAFQEAYLAANQAADRFHANSGVFAPYLSSYLKGSSRQSASQALGLAAPGARVASADALQTDPIEGIDFTDYTNSTSLYDDFTIRCIDAISGDFDIRAALMLGDLIPPAALALRQ